MELFRSCPSWPELLKRFNSFKKKSFPAQIKVAQIKKKEDKTENSPKNTFASYGVREEGSKYRVGVRVLNHLFRSFVGDWSDRRLNCGHTCYKSKRRRPNYASIFLHIFIYF